MTVARTFFIIAFLSYWLRGSVLRLQLDHSRFPIEPADQRIQDHPGWCRTNARRQSEHEAVCIQQLPYHTTHGFRPSDGRSARRSSTKPRDNLPDPSMSLDPARTLALFG